MLSQLLSASLQIIIITVISLCFIRIFDKKTLQNLFLAIVFFLIASLLLIAPIEYNTLNFTNTYWNFSGKLYVILFSLVFFLIFKNRFKEHNYIKLKQEKTSFKSVIIVFIILILFGLLDGFIFGKPQSLDNEKLIYQFLMPGIDEELTYRGVLLGLFSSILVKEIKIISLKINPSILITGILFGIIHGLKTSENLEITFNTFITCKTFIYGCFWAWITIKTKSILSSIIFHNYSNVTPMLVRSFLNN